LLVLACAQGAAADERPVVAGTTVYVSGGRIVCDVTCGGLFSERIVGTIESGLPAVVELLYTLEREGGGTVESGVHTFELGYDVWEDVFSVEAGDSSTYFESFDVLKTAIERLRGVPLAPMGRVDPAGVYTVHVTVAVHPLSGSDHRRIEGYVEEAVGARTHDSWREQVLNINDLIGWFFSRDKGTTHRSDVYRTAAFTPGSLPGAARPPEGRRYGAPDGMIVALEVP
jgi:hypothetical protein